MDEMKQKRMREICEMANLREERIGKFREEKKKGKERNQMVSEGRK